MAPDDPTVGEVYRLIQDVRGDIRRLDGRVSEVHGRIDGLGFVSHAEYQADRRAFEQRIVDLEEGNRWRGRMLVTSLVTAVVAPILVALVLVNLLGGAT